MISKPEAAVTYSLHVRDPNSLKVRDKIVCLDAGGGTVDLVTFLVESMLDNQIGIKEADPSDDDTCGSMFLNRAFTRWLTTTCSDDPAWSDTIRAEAEAKLEDYIKKEFDGTIDPVVPVQGLADNAAKPIKNGRLTVSGATMRSIFEPVVSAICNLLLRKIRVSGGVKTVYQVGGFGENDYLQDCVRQALAIVNPQIELILPQHGQSAVPRGALLSALALRTPEKCSIKCRPDPSSQRIWSEFDEGWDISKMLWAVKKGDQVKKSGPMHLNFMTRHLKSLGKFRNYSFTIRVYEGQDDGPEFANKGTRELVVLRAGLSDIPEGQIPAVKSKDGKDYYNPRY